MTGESRSKSADSSVLVICNLPSYPGKVERHLNPLASAGGEVTVISPLTHESISDETSEEMTIHGVAVESELLSKFLALFLSIHVLFKEDFDAIVSVSLFPYGIYGLLAGSIFRTPVHLRIIGADIPNHSRSKYRILPLYLFRKFDSIAVHGTCHKEFLLNNQVPEEKVHILPGSIDVEKFGAACDEDGTYDFIWLAGMKSHKRPELFVHALSRLRERGHEFHAVMVGGGPCEATVDEIIKSEGLSDVIDRPGWVDVEKTTEYYSTSEIFVMTSSREALGYPLIEAMATGLVCVAPEYSELADGNTSYIVTDMEDGILVPDMSPGSLADTLELLLEDERLRRELSQNALESSQRFSSENMRDGWAEILDDLVREKAEA